MFGDGGAAMCLQKERAMGKCRELSGLVGVVIASLWAVSGAVRAEDPLAFAELQGLSDNSVTAVDINEHGQVVGYVRRDDIRAWRAVLWEHGLPQELGTLGGDDSAAEAIDDRGRVVGWAEYEEGSISRHAFIWQDGVMTDLNDLIGGARARWELREATDINKQGYIVGYGSYSPGGSRAFLLRLSRPEDVIMLPPLDVNHTSAASAVNRTGQVIGTSGDAGVLWDKGVAIDLGNLGYERTQPLSINSAGHVVGRSWLGPDQRHAFLWTPESGITDLGTLGGEQSLAHAILDDGTIVGSAYDESAESRAFRYRDGLMTDLNALLPPQFDGEFVAARGTNAAGQILGGRGFTKEVVANPVCSNIKRVEVTCFRGDAVRANVKTRLPAGSLIGITGPGATKRFLEVDARGRVRTEWTGQSNDVEVCVGGCPEACGEAACLPPPENYLLVNPENFPFTEGSDAFSVNENGDTVGWSNWPEFRRATLWSHDWILDLGTLGGSYSVARDINDAGQIVGSADLREGQSHAYVWERGGMTDLGTLGGDESTASAINNLGWVVGWSDTADKQIRGFLWRDGQMTPLDSLYGILSGARDINDHGQIVGDDFVEPDRRRAVLWSEGQPPRDLGTLGGSESSATAINEAGMVVGEARNSDGRTRAFLWTEDEGMVELEALGRRYSDASDINAKGQIVGRTSVRRGEITPFLWRDGVMTDLHQLAPVNCREQRLLTALAINDRSEIVGTTYIPGSGYQTYLMTPAYCGDIRKFKVTCNRKNTLAAKLSTAYRRGTVLSLISDEGESRCVTIGPTGRGRATWEDQSGQREICIEHCRDVCEAVDCG